MPPTANEALRDALLAHHIGLRRLANHELEALLKILRRNDAEVLAMLRQRLPDIARRIAQGVDPLSGEITRRLDTFTKQRLVHLYAEVRSVRAEAAREMAERLGQGLEGLSVYEQQYVRGAVASAIPKGVRPFVGQLSLASAELLRQTVVSKPFQGKTLGRHFTDLMSRNGIEAWRMKRAIENGIVQGHSIQQIVRGVRHRALGLTRANVSAIAHSAVQHVSLGAREQFGKENSEVVGAYQWVGTLDSKICTVCIIRDGHTYDLETKEPLDGGPPWGAGPGNLHYNDRCTASYVLKSWQEMGITRRDLPGAMRASMDGQVPAKISAEQWVNSQGFDRLSGMFGPKRAALLTQGDLDIRDLIRNDGTLWNLDTLRGLESAAFEAAGI